MIPTFPSKVTLSRLFTVVQEIDQELAEETRKRPCPYCGGWLSNAWYPRKIRGFPLSLIPVHVFRLSLCCQKEGCRRRVLPPSCLFLGRRVYGACIVLISVALQQLKATTAERVEQMLGVPVRTLRRWMTYFRTDYLRTREWLVRQGYIVAEGASRRAIGIVYQHFVTKGADDLAGLCGFTRFMSLDPVAGPG